ncbi:MAG: hypothetical protein HC790_12225 [Acaryochloridaceae cyanobacterium CSU_3_4]|nr:hypothetical protein [Acaryochloridaceae cyanobacterium CSU_3_4]
MQTLTARQRVASQRPNPTSLKTLSNPEYVSTAQAMLSANAQERVALEELAAAVGLSGPEILSVMGQEFRQ